MSEAAGARRFTSPPRLRPSSVSLSRRCARTATTVDEPVVSTDWQPLEDDSAYRRLLLRLIFGPVVESDEDAA